jgi:hypothetical protein
MGPPPYISPVNKEADEPVRRDSMTKAQNAAPGFGTRDTTAAASPTGVYILIGVRISKIIIYDELNALLQKF